MRLSSLRPWSAWSSPARAASARWAGVVTDVGGVYIERVCGPAHARWTVHVGERAAIVIEPESVLDGERSDRPLPTLRSVHVEHEARQRHVVVFDHGHAQVRLVCSDPAVAARVASRCGALAVAAREAAADVPAGVPAHVTAGVTARSGGRRRSAGDRSPRS